MTPADHRTSAIALLDASVKASQSAVVQLAGFRAGLARRLLRGAMAHGALKPSPLGDIPEHWEVRSLGEVASLTSGKTKPKDASYLRSPARSVPIYGGNGLLGFTGSALRSGSTLVIGRIGARCGAVHFVPEQSSWITDNALFVYETRPEIDLRFLYYSLLSRDLLPLRNRGSQPLISLAGIYPVLLAVPPVAEQREICAILLCVDAFRDAEEKVADQAKKLRAALLCARPAQ